ncbi:sugar porter family MFS transporter [Porticoccus sp. GXU_MW_L64]
MNHNNKKSVYLIASVAALGGLLFGYDTGVIAGTQLYFSKYFGLSAAEQGWAVSSALYGCLVGSMAGGFLTRKYSRKYTMIFAAVLFVISAWGSGVAGSLTELVIYRIVGGLGVGMASLAAPMYIAEISPSAQRGKMVSLYQLAVVVGFFVVFVATYVIGGGDTGGLSAAQLDALHDHNLQRGWRVMFWSELVPACAFLLLLFWVPHSPRWLVSVGRNSEAKRVLQRITPSAEEADNEYADIQQSFDGGAKKAALSAILKGSGFVLLLGILLSVFQQITGINAILYYGAEIFSNALGYGPEDALKQQLWLGTVNLVFTFVAIYTVDRWGRKPLFISGSIGMCIGLLTLGWTIYTQTMGVLSLVAILVFIGSFAMSMGPVVWVMLSEIFPNRLRSFAMSVAVAAQWLFNAIVANSFPVINGSALNQQQFNGALPYFLFAFFCILAIVFVWRKVPETKGKSLEEMESLWK